MSLMMLSISRSTVQIGLRPVHAYKTERIMLLRICVNSLELFGNIETERLFLHLESNLHMHRHQEVRGSMQGTECYETANRT